MGQVCSSEAVEKQASMPVHYGAQELHYTQPPAPSADPAPPQSPPTVESPPQSPSPTPSLPPRRLTPITPFESVLTNATLFPHIVSFQDGLPGLLRDLKRDLQTNGGDEYYLPVAAVKRHKLRALEMIDAIRQLPQYHDNYDLKQYSSAADAACQVNDVEILRWIINCPTVDHRLTRSDMKRLWRPAVTHFQPGDFRILELLMEYFTPAQVAKLDKNCWSRIESVELLQWLHERFPIKISKEVFHAAVRRGDSAFVDFWLENRPEPLPKHSLTNALYSGDTWFLFLKLQLNKSIVPDDEERLNLIMGAVEQQDLALLKLLHMYSTTYPFTKQPVEALELAAERGHLEIFDELYLHHKDIISARSIELAATNGHVHVLEFLYTRTMIEGVPEALDGAAANGHLACVRFLHEKRLFTATTKAMDMAATNGHLAVVQYLHEHRREGCTAQALAGAAENEHDTVTKWLIENRSEVRSAGGLDGLLLAGKTSDWLFYREEWKLFGDDAVDGSDHLGELLFQAGRRGKMAALRFICTALNGEDLLHRAYDGAVEIASVSWLFAIQELETSKTTKRVPFSTIERAVELEKHDYRFEVCENERVDALKWLVMHCADKDEFAAMRDALQLLTALRGDEDEPHNHHYHHHRHYEELDMVTALTRWGERRGPPAQEMKALRAKYSRNVFSLAARGTACDWVIERAVKDLLPRFECWHDRECASYDVEDKDPWLLGVWTWPKRAVARNDLTVLHFFRELSLAGADVCDEPDKFAIDDSVMDVAVATGHIEILQWYIAECCDAERATLAEHTYLLENAVKYGQPHMADWLLREMPQCCTDISGDRSFDVWPQNADARIFDWFDRLENDHPTLVKHLNPLYIAHSLAHEGQVELLDRFITTHPQLRAQITDILLYTGYGGHLDAVKYAYGVLENHFSPNGEPVVVEDDDLYKVQQAMAAAASEGKLEIVEFLFGKFPGVNWHYAVRDAASYSHVRVLRFFFKNGYEKNANYSEIRDKASSGIRRLAYFCRAQGADFL